MPFRPVAVSLGKTVNNGWGGFECCWARTMLADAGRRRSRCRAARSARRCGSTAGAAAPGQRACRAPTASCTTRSTRPTRRAGRPQPNIRNAYRTMVPLAANGPWSQALGPTHFSWMFLDETPKGLPRVTLPDVWFVYRTNPGDLVLGHGRARREDGALSVHGRLRLHARRDQPLRRHPAARRDRPREPAADPHRRHQVRRAVLGCTRASRCASPRSSAQGEARDFTDIATELAAAQRPRSKNYNAAINKGAAGVPLKGAHWDHSLALDRRAWRARRSGTPCAAPPAPS